MGQLSKSATHSRWFVTAACIGWFTTCGICGLVWGSFVKSPPRPALVGVPVYPNAQAVVDLAARVAGLSSPTPDVPALAPRGLSHFMFETNNPPEAVLAYYRELLSKQGFYLRWQGTPTPQSMNLTFIRANEDDIAENITLAIIEESPGQVKVTVKMDVWRAR